MSYLSAKSIQQFFNLEAEKVMGVSVVVNRAFHVNKGIPDIVKHNSDYFEMNGLSDPLFNACVTQEAAERIWSSSWDDFDATYNRIWPFEYELYSLKSAYFSSHEDAPEGYDPFKRIRFSADDAPKILQFHHDIFDPSKESGRFQQALVKEVARRLECEW